MVNNLYIQIICAFGILSIATTEFNAQNKFSCNYLNEPTPGNTPVLFGMGVVSVEGENTHACTFSPDGNMLIFSRYPEKKSYIMTFSDGQWSDPKEAFFEGKETSITVDGNKVFYYKNGGDIYYNEKTENGWGNSTSVGNVINTSETEYYPSITSDGTLFFSRNSNWDNGRIMFSTFTEGKFNTPVDIGLPVNNGGALHAYVAPDKSFMLFNSPRTGSYTQLDIWLSFRNTDGSWTNPQNPGETINSGADAILCPTVTPDGKYMFFTKLVFSGNTGNVYWVSTHFIDSLRNATSIQNNKTSNLNIFPNPTKGMVRIPLSEFSMNEGLLQIIDSRGSQLLSQTFHNTTQPSINLTGFPKGFYLIKTVQNNNINCQKICLE
jgi:hypothetical protein